MHAEPKHDHPHHQNIQFTTATAIYTYSEGVTVKWTSMKSTFPNQDYKVEISHPASTQTYDGLSLANLGLQGTHNLIKLREITNAQIGFQQPGGQPLVFVDPTTPDQEIPAAGVSRASGIPRMADEKIIFIRAKDHATPITMIATTINSRRVQPRYNNYKTLHDAVPPPFPPGSSEDT